MGGLIPLLLQSGPGESRGSIVFPTRHSSLPPSSSPGSTSPARHSPLSPTIAQFNLDDRLTQLPLRPSSRTPSPQRLSLLFNKPLPPKPLNPKKMLKRFNSLPPGAYVDVPSSSNEWKKMIAEIKRLHHARRFRLCSAKCCEILETLKGDSQVEPAYLIYLHFYAASSLETTARPIPTTSPLRVKLLEQARAHYSDAASLIQVAEDNAVAMSRSSSTMSMSSSSTVTATFSRQHSPTGSFSSRAPTPATDVSSPGCPASSMFMPPGPPPPMAAPSPPVKKKVSFYMPIPEEPIVRPDSPTLGFDDFEAIENASRELPPLPPHPTRLSILKALPPPLDVPSHGPRTLSVSSLASSSASALTGSQATSGPRSDTSTHSSSPHSSLCSSAEFDGSTYRSLVRFCGHLDGLRAQVAYHITSVDAELRTCMHSPTYDPTTCRPGSAMSGDGSRPGSRSSVSSDGMPLEDLSERLERLRATGWRRPRFNPHHYEVLRERVLEELSVA